MPTVTGRYGSRAACMPAKRNSARSHHARAQVHAARPDDHRRHDSRCALPRPNDNGQGVCRPAQCRGARARKPTASTSSSSMNPRSTSTCARSGNGHRGAAPGNRRASLHHRHPHLLRLRHPGQCRLEGNLGNQWRQYQDIFPALARSRIDQISIECRNRASQWNC